MGNAVPFQLTVVADRW